MDIENHPGPLSLYQLPDRLIRGRISQIWIDFRSPRAIVNRHYAGQMSQRSHQAARVEISYFSLGLIYPSIVIDPMNRDETNSLSSNSLDRSYSPFGAVIIIGLK